MLSGESRRGTLRLSEHVSRRRRSGDARKRSNTDASPTFRPPPQEDEEERDAVR